MAFQDFQIPHHGCCLPGRLLPANPGSGRCAGWRCPRPSSGPVARRDDGSTPYLPEVSVLAPGAERILHLHRNVPGVLARLNHALASHNMNIGSQTLATSGEYSYVVTDVSGEHYEGLLAELQDLEERWG